LLASQVVLAGCACRVWAWDYANEGDEVTDDGEPLPDLPTGDLPIPDGRAEAEVQVVMTADVDLLFVVDNSATLADEQVFLASNAASFVNILDQANVNYRIGFTTTDVGGEHCKESTPERGALVTRNCLEHPWEFVSGNDAVFDKVCGDYCQLEDVEILPSATAEDPTPIPRPWLEKIQGVSNLPVEVSMPDALTCFLPQGIAGCRFESPLEAMYLALQRVQDPGDPAFGFLREGASLAVVLVTDEVDCSAATEALFDGSNTMYWPEPNDLTSAVCWNAGVECLGPGPVYDDCFPANKDLAGNVGVPDGQAVMHPISRYLDQLIDLDAFKQSQDPGTQVSVSAIAGVPTGFPGDPIVYADTNDANFMNAFGIGPGCESGTAQAVPPPRIKAVTDAFGLDSAALISVCGEDYSPALTAIGDTLGVEDDPPCFPICVGDVDPGTPGLQPDCLLTEQAPGQEPVELPHCIDDGDGGWTLPDGEPTCFYELVDDAVTAACVSEGANLEFGVLRTEPVQEGTVLVGNCVVSDMPEIDCP
jgi:hypothetical protein